MTMKTSDVDGMIFFDGHCDALAPFTAPEAVNEPRDLLERGDEGHVDYPRLKEGGFGCQTLAVFVEDGKLARAAEYTHECFDRLESYAAREPLFRRALTASDVERAKADGAVSFLMSIEGGEAIRGSVDELRAFHARGVRMLGLTWNRRNELARGVRAPGTDGLTDAGRKVVKEMEKLGMIVDVSHLSDAALDDVLAIAERPLVATHSNARAVFADDRNLDDARIEAIAKTGGLVGLTFVPPFLSADPNADMMEALLDHVDRVVAVAGVDHAGFGSDFDGYDWKVNAPIKNAAEYPLIARALSDRGYSREDVAKIMGGNWLRVLRAVAG